MYIKRLPLGDVEANCYIICDETTKVGAVLDVGGFSEELLNEIKKAGIEELKYILCTHGHFDHIAGVKKFKEMYPEAKIVIGEKDAILTEDSDKNGVSLASMVVPSARVMVLHTLLAGAAIECDVANIARVIKRMIFLYM